MDNLVNLMEAIVEFQLDECMAELNSCSCKRCRQDIKALALNNLPTHYVTQPESTTMLLCELNKAQKKTDIHAAITKAIQVVAAKPRHEDWHLGKE